MEAPPRNNTSFPTWAAARLRELYTRYLDLRDEGPSGPGASEERRTAAVLKYFQFLAQSMMADPDFDKRGGRGLLIYFTMGLGKTYLAIAMAMAMWDSRQPIVVASKFLHRNFRDSVDEFVALMNPDADKDELARMQKTAQGRFSYVSSDAYNMADQLARASLGPRAKKGPAGGRRGAPKVSGSLEDRFLIVDEAHNLFRAIINNPSEDTNARRLYEMVMETKNIRIAFLTGTPSAKNPFELVPCFNMLAGYDLFPTGYDVFVRLYVDLERSRVRNRLRFMNRIVGLVSHAGPDQLGAVPVGAAGNPGGSAGIPPRGAGGLPEVFPEEIVRIPMSPLQYRAYIVAREREEAEGRGTGSAPGRSIRAESSKPLALPGSERETESTYYVRSRTLSNFAPPSRKWAAAAEAVADMPPEVFTAEHSPKIARLVANIGAAPLPALVYSQFVGVGGLAVIARFLEIAGYVRYVPGSVETDSPETDDTKRYALISGEVPQDDRGKIRATFNSLSNLRGGVIAVLLVSKTGAEGFDLRYVRQVHKTEPYWDKARELQVNARAVRMGSHDALPPDERDVRLYLYISDANEDVRSHLRPESREAQTIDEQFHERGLQRLALNDDMRLVLRSAALECSFYGGPDCRLCVPSGARLFDDDFAVDLEVPDPCEPLTSSAVEARPIVHQGVEYFYRKDPTGPYGYRFYVHDPVLEGYVPLDPSDPVYEALAAAAGMDTVAFDDMTDGIIGGSIRDSDEFHRALSLVSSVGAGVRPRTGGRESDAAGIARAFTRARDFGAPYVMFVPRGSNRALDGPGVVAQVSGAAWPRGARAVDSVSGLGGGWLGWALKDQPCLVDPRLNDLAGVWLDEGLLVRVDGPRAAAEFAAAFPPAAPSPFRGRISAAPPPDWGRVAGLAAGVVFRDHVRGTHEPGPRWYATLAKPLVIVWDSRAITRLESLWVGPG